MSAIEYNAMSKALPLLFRKFAVFNTIWRVFLIASSNYIATFPSVSLQCEQLPYESAIKPAMMGKTCLP